jgi:hypothetical protein
MTASQHHPVSWIYLRRARLITRDNKSGVHIDGMNRKTGGGQGRRKQWTDANGDAEEIY